MSNEERGVPASDRIIGWGLLAAAAVTIVGAAVYVAPLMLAEGWSSPLGVVFLASAPAALALGVGAVTGVARKLR